MSSSLYYKQQRRKRERLCSDKLTSCKLIQTYAQETEVFFLSSLFQDTKKRAKYLKNVFSYGLKYFSSHSVQKK